MTANRPDSHEPTIERGPKPDIDWPMPTASLGWMVLVVAVVAVIVGLAASGTVAVANGAPTWVLAVTAFGGAVAGIWSGRLILRLFLPGAAPDSTTSTIDLRLDDDDRIG